jgi:hypothetical protein
MSRVSTSSTPDRELSLAEMLADPIVQTVMTRDGVTTEEMEGLIGAVRDRLAGRRVASHQTGRLAPGAVAIGD